MITAKKANEIFLQNSKSKIHPSKDKFIEYLDMQIQKAAKSGCYTIVILETSLNGNIEFQNVDEFYLNNIIYPILKENGYGVSYEEYFEKNYKHYRFEISWK